MTPLPPASASIEQQRAQVAAQYRAVAHMARAIAEVHEEAASIFCYPASDDLLLTTGSRSHRIMEILGDILNGMDASRMKTSGSGRSLKKRVRFFRLKRDPPMSDVSAPASARPALSDAYDRDAADALELAQYLRATPIELWRVGLGPGDKDLILEALALFVACSLHRWTADMSLRVLDLFSCLGHHAIGLRNAGDFDTVAFVECNPWRRVRLAIAFPQVRIHDDIGTYIAQRDEADILFGGPPCQQTSRPQPSMDDEQASLFGQRCDGLPTTFAQNGLSWNSPPVTRSGKATALATAQILAITLPDLSLRLETLVRLTNAGVCSSWPAPVCRDWRSPGRRDHPRLTASRGQQMPEVLGTRVSCALLPVDAWAAGEYGRGRARERIEEIEALGDSNPPELAEVIGHCILAAARPPRATVPEAGGAT